MRERSGAVSSGTAPFLYGVCVGVFSFIASGLFAQNQEIIGSWFFHSIKIEPELFIRNTHIPAWVAFGKYML